MVTCFQSYLLRCISLLPLTPNKTKKHSNFILKKKEFSLNFTVITLNLNSNFEKKLFPLLIHESSVSFFFFFNCYFVSLHHILLGSQLIRVQSEKQNQLYAENEMRWIGWSTSIIVYEVSLWFRVLHCSNWWKRLIVTHYTTKIVSKIILIWPQYRWQNLDSYANNCDLAPV